jgi:hypothetical protein
LNFGGWHDPQTVLHFGATALWDVGWVFQPYIDSIGNQHPDIFKSIKKDMGHCAIYSVNDGPIVIYMGREDKANPPWTEAAFQAWDWLRACEGSQ